MRIWKLSERFDYINRLNVIGLAADLSFSAAVVGDVEGHLMADRITGTDRYKIHKKTQTTITTIVRPYRVGEKKRKRWKKFSSYQ